MPVYEFSSYLRVPADSVKEAQSLAVDCCDAVSKAADCTLELDDSPPVVDDDEDPGPPVAGDRVRAVKWGQSKVIDDNLTVPPGTEGVVTGVDEAHKQVWVRWDNGAVLALIQDYDRYEVIA